MHATIPKGNMGYNQYTVPDIVAVEPSSVVFFNHWQIKRGSMASRVILSNFEFFEEQ